MKKIGIISDTHDNLTKLAKAVKFFNRNKVDFVLHAGDFVAPFTVLALKGLSCEWAGVFGNNDGERRGLAAVSAGRIKEGPSVIKLENKKIALVHELNQLGPKIKYVDLVVFGHTHRPEVIKKENKIFINPGECGGWLTGTATFAMLNLASLSVRIVEI